MLNHTLEFLRIADIQPSDEKVRKRRESAAELLKHFETEENRDILLAILQGVVGGFNGAPFSQDSEAVTLLIESIKDQDATLPHDLAENALELRAVAAITIGESLTARPAGRLREEAILVAIALKSALSCRPRADNSHIRAMLSTLGSASEKVIATAAQHRRQRSNSALAKLEKLKQPADAAAAVGLIASTVNAALREVTESQAADREELETLWWMFGAYSEIEQKPLAALSPSAASFCSGIELARRALLPPSPSAEAMIRRAVELGRKQNTLGALQFQNVIDDWTPSMLSALAPQDPERDRILSSHPALLPLSNACLRLRECKDAPKLGKDFASSTGFPLNHAQTPAQWGAQVFHEAILLRMATDEED